MNSANTAIGPVAPSVTPEQLDLVRRTIVTPDATPEELKLYLFDCARQGVHPLDRLLHFSKRAGRYTPITSIDFMRIRAAETGEAAGSDDATFVEGDPYPRSAFVTVWRLVAGQRYAFSATARWAEYYPGDGREGFMWRKMPRLMLAKCAEALALRKGFPKQLAGVYIPEELEQASPENGAPDPPPPPIEPAVQNDQAPPADMPEGAVTIRRVHDEPTRNPKVKKFYILTSSGEEVQTINHKLAHAAESARDDNAPVWLTSESTRFGNELKTIKRVTDPPPAPPMLPVDDIPF